MLKQIRSAGAARRTRPALQIGERSRSWPALQVLLLLGLALLLATKLSTAPPLWWDEGWTLAVARNWVKSGHYGQFLAGEPVAPGLAASPTVVLPIAVSFRLLGVGPWQGRLPGVIYTVLSLWLLYRVTATLYSRRTGLMALALAILVPMAPELHPLLMGRQVLGEIPTLCFLLMGYLALFRGLETRRVWGFLGAGLCWSLAVLTKSQAIPFLGLSVLAVGVVLFQKRNWRLLSLCVLPLFVVAASFQAWLWFAGSRWPTAGTMHGLLATTALVPTLPSRLMATMTALLAGLPFAVGLVHAARHHLGLGSRSMMRLAVWVLASSWFVWYLLLSVGWVRYLFPAAFLSLIFLAALLRDVTDDFDHQTLTALWQRMRKGRWRSLSVQQQMAAALLLLSVPVSLVVLARAYLDADDSIYHLAEYLRRHVESDALIETYDPEIMFLTDQRYHFPPDQVHVLLNRRTFLGDRDVKIEYDPLAADPDYLITGPYSKLWELYPDELLAQHFRFEEEFGTYRVYKSVGFRSATVGETLP